MYDKNISPVGWYVASYLIRLIELEAADNEDFLGDKFIRWNYFNKLIERQFKYEVQHLGSFWRGTHKDILMLSKTIRNPYELHPF